MKMLIQHKIQAGFAVALAFLLLTGASTWWSMRRNVETFRAVDHTHEVIEALHETLVEMLNTETGNRGFAISGDENFLEPYQAGITAVQQSFAEAKRLTQDNPDQQRRLAALEPLMQKKINLEKEIIKLRRSGDTAGALQIIASGQGKQMMDEIRKLIAAMEADENRHLQQRTAKAQALSRTTIAVVIFASLLAFGLVGLASVMVRRDFEKRQRAEAALLRSEEKLAVTLDSIGDAVLATDAEGRVTRLNPIAEKLTGWSEAEAKGRPVAEVFHIINEETRALSVIPVEKVLATGEIHGLANHTIIIARDGTERPIADSAAPIRDKNGQVLGVVLVFRDVTQEKHLEKIQKQFTAIVESSDDAIISKSLDGLITGWNAGAERMFGYSAQEAVGQPMLMLIPPERADEEPGILARMRRGERIDHFETRRVRKDGVAIDVAVTLSPIKDAAGEVIGISKIARDITEHKRMEEAIHASEVLNRAVLNSVMANIAVVDKHGIIIAVNEGWKLFAQENGADASLPGDGVGANYLEVCAGLGGGGAGNIEWTAGRAGRFASHVQTRVCLPLAHRTPLVQLADFALVPDGRRGGHHPNQHYRAQAGRAAAGGFEDRPRQSRHRFHCGRGRKNHLCQRQVLRRLQVCARGVDGAGSSNRQFRASSERIFPRAVADHHQRVFVAGRDQEPRQGWHELLGGHDHRPPPQ